MGLEGQKRGVAEVLVGRRSGIVWEPEDRVHNRGIWGFLGGISKERLRKTWKKAFRTSRVGEVRLHIQSWIKVELMLLSTCTYDMNWEPVVDVEVIHLIPMYNGTGIVPEE